MKKLGGVILDHFEDVYGLLFDKVASDIDVGPTDNFSTEDKQMLGDKDFALIIISKNKLPRRVFPINNKINTQLSLGYLLHQAHHLSPSYFAIAARNIRRACKAFDIAYPKTFDTLPRLGSTSNIAQECVEYDKMVENALDKAKSKIPQVVKCDKTAAENDSNWGLVQEKRGRVFRVFPMMNKDMTKKACEMFDKKFRDYAPNDRRVLAKNIMVKCAKYGVKPTDLIKKYAGETISPTFTEALELRARYLPDLENRQCLKEIEKKASELGPEKTASILELFDKQTTLSKLWDWSIPDPYLSVFGKLAETKTATQKFTETIKKIPISVIKDNLTEKIAKEWESDPVKTWNKLDISTKDLIVNKSKEL